MEAADSFFVAEVEVRLLLDFVSAMVDLIRDGSRAAVSNTALSMALSILFAIHVPQSIGRHYAYRYDGSDLQ